MGEERGVGGVQVRVPPRRRIALTSGRCHQTRAGGRGAPRFGGKSRDSSRFEQHSLIVSSNRRADRGAPGGINGSHHADRDGDTACVPRTRIVDVAGRPRRSVITAPRVCVARWARGAGDVMARRRGRPATSNSRRTARQVAMASPEAVDGSRLWRTSTWTGARSNARTRARKAGFGSRGRAGGPRTGPRRRPVA